jgi:uncharacterized membrane protein (Fun14 family)
MKKYQASQMEEKLNNMHIDLPYLEMGSGFMMGLSVGYVVKKSFKLMLLLMGLILIALFVLENQHIITLNEASLDESVTLGTTAFQHFVGFLKDRLSSLKVAGGVSAAVGFVAGLKMG